MSKLENKRKRIIKIRRSALVAIVLSFFCLIFYFSARFYSKKDIATSANISNGTITTNKSKPSTNTSMNSRESKVSSKEPSTDSSTINVYKSDGHKIAFLTFDDGPSANTTPGILKTLDKYNVKATFFIIGSMAIIKPDLVKMEFKDGQSIENHTYSHNYKYLYSNPNALIGDVNKCNILLKSILGNGYDGKLVRFPGGSFGSKMEPFRVAIKNEGYHYIDWNDITGDADRQNVPVNELLNNLKKYTIGKQHVVILMHDASDKETTVQALPQVIEYLKSQGYSFNTLK